MGEEEDWRDAWARGAAAWPGLNLTLEDLVAHVAGRVPPPTDDVAHDLYLAAACAKKEPQAVRAFDAAYRAHLDGVIRRLGRSGARAEDARQAVYERVFGGTTPKIAEYAGKGTLKSWLRVVTVRVVLNLSVRADDEEPVSDADAFGMLAASSPELEAMKMRYAVEFREALRTAAASLDVRARAVLRLAFCDGLSIDEIGTVYAVHRATAARWVQKAHEELAARVQTELRTRLATTDSEYQSIVRLVASQLDTSLSRYLV